MNSLPEDLLLLIARKLEPGNLILWRQVCRYWYKLGYHESIINTTMSLRNSILQDDEEWKDRFLFEQSLTSIYPGIEKYLDLYHCLARSTRSNHLPAVQYFLRRVTKDNLADCEFATLIDLTTDPNILTLFLDKLSLCHPQVDRKQFVGDKKSSRRIKRAPLHEYPYQEKYVQISPWSNLSSGFKITLKGLTRDKVRRDEWTFSREMRLLCRQLPR